MTPAASGAAVRASAIAAQPDFHRLKERVIGASGLEYYADKDAALAERAEHRRAALGCSAPEYVRRLLDPRDDRELAALIDEITVGETYFFRYPSQFDALRQAVIPACLARRAGERRLRLWSAGCASGAEPYSLAILLRLDLAGLLAGWEVSILATDINRRALDQARAGVFSKWELRTVGAELRRRCFVPAGTQWRIRPEFRAGLRFERQNLAAEIETFARRHAGDFDVILCRNVMIYFGAGVMRRVIRGLAECLAPGGWLLVGHAEPFFEIANILAPAAVAGATLYRKTESGAGAAAPLPWTGAAWSAPDLEATPAGGAPDPAAEAAAFPLADVAGPAPAPPPLVAPVTPAPRAAPAPQAAPQAPPRPAAADGAAAALAAVRRHADSGDWNAAMAACEQAIHDHPLDAAAYYTYALLSEHVGLATAATEALRQAIYLDRGMAMAHYHLGRCLMQAGESAAAERSFANALRLIAGRGDGEPVPLGDNLSVGELRRLIEVHRGLLEERR